jgi:membrane protein required for colicin V production
MDSLPIGIVDLTAVVILLFSAGWAFSRGFIHELLAMAGWLGAGFAALYGLPYLKPQARQLIPINWAADAAASLIIFLFTLFLLSMITHAISRRIRESALNSVDRGMGFLFGAARGALIICLAYLVTEWLVPPPEQPPWLRQAKTMPWIEKGTRLLASLAPEQSDQAKKAARGAAEAAKDAIETKNMVDKLAKPEPKPPEPREGYGEKERRDMDRLMQSAK